MQFDSFKWRQIFQSFLTPPTAEKKPDMRVINDPLGQTHSPASSDNYFRLKFWFVSQDFEKWERTDIETTRAKIMITTGRDCGSASWINYCQ